MLTAIIAISGAAFGLYLLRKIQEHKWGYCRSKRLMERKVVIITGANTGLGKETAIDLAKRGAHVVLACRSRLSAQKAISEIRKITTGGQLTFIELDLSSLASVRECSLNILEKFSHIDVLINNAGLSVPPKDEKKTADGFEIHFGVNYLGHFLFTHLLLDRLKETENSRIIIVSSVLYEKGEIDFDNLNGAMKSHVNRSSVRNPLYCNSKLENILHATKLAEIVKGSSVGVYSLSPGFVKTDLMRHYLPQFGTMKRICFMPIAFLFMRSARQGAQTTIHCAVSEELDNVKFGFYRNCKPAHLLPKSMDYQTVERLYEESMKLIKEYI